jgi:predicted transcriptional regulator
VKQKELKNISKNISSSFNKVKQELDDHLYAINQNTLELSIIQEQLGDLASKIDKLNQRVDELSLPNHKESLGFNIELNLREQEIFLTLYTSKNPVSIIDLTDYLGISEERVNKILYQLLTKGIPVQTVSDSEDTTFFLTKEFKELQAQKTIVTINEAVVKEFQNFDAEQFLE